MDSLKRYMLPFLVIVLLMVLVESFRSFFLAYIIEPISLLCWAVLRILNSVHQNIYWVMLIAVCVILVIHLIPMERDNITRSTYDYRYRSRNRAEHWKRLIANAMYGDKDVEPLRESLKKLLMSTLSENEESGSKDFEETAISKRVSLSPRAMGFLFPSKRSGEESSGGGRSNVFCFTPGWLRERAGKSVQRDAASIDEILEYIETEMETRHDQ